MGNIRKDYYILRIGIGVLLLFSLLFSEEFTGKINLISHSDIGKLLREKASRNLTITEKMAEYSEMFLGIPYSWTATGDGIDAIYEPWPLVNFDSTNCMVYIEHVLALSISDSWDHFFNNLQHIRYMNGEIGMQTRNHYTMADWLPENSWLLEDVSMEVGENLIRDMTRTISHKQFFKSKGIEDLLYIKDDRTITIKTILFASFSKVFPKLKNGDIIVLLFANKKDIFAAHMLLTINKNNDLYFREASTRSNSVIETEAKLWTNQMSKTKRYAGVSILRIKEKINTKKHIILPENIKKLK